MAGFAKFWPMPPKRFFTITMANREPTTAIQIGKVEGRLKASRMPVTTALRSPMVWGFLQAILNRYSPTTQVITQVAMRISDLMPKITTEATAAGSRAMITSRIREEVVTLSLI